jgi:hypothetical protein
VQKQLLRGVWAQSVHANRRRQHAAGMKEKVQMGTTIWTEMLGGDTPPT